MNEDHRHARALVHQVKRDAVSDARRMDWGLSCVPLRKAGAGDYPEDRSKDRDAKMGGTDSWLAQSEALRP